MQTQQRSPLLGVRGCTSEWSGLLGEIPGHTQQQGGLRSDRVCLEEVFVNAVTTAAHLLRV